MLSANAKVGPREVRIGTWMRMRGTQHTSLRTGLALGPATVDIDLVMIGRDKGPVVRLQTKATVTIESTLIPAAR